MPLELKYDIETPGNRLSINFIEKTGSYSTGNLGGYGAPNPYLSDIISAQISITKRGGTTYNINVYPTLPTNDPTLKYLIPATSFGFASGEKITDGLYQVAYQVQYLDSGNNVITSSDSFYFPFIEGLKCCVSKMRSKISVSSSPCVGCEDKQRDEINQMSALVEGICDLVECDKLNKAQEVIDYVQKYCNCNCADC